MKLVVDRLSFGYPHSRPLLKEISFCAESGELISLLGPNGTGKTTLFRCILGQLRASGEMTLDGQPLSSLSPRQLASRIAYIPQSPFPCILLSGRRDDSDGSSRRTEMVPASRQD